MSRFFRGVIAYPPTPFDHAGDVRPQVLEQLVAQLAGSGVDGIALLGSSGSGMYLSRDERRSLVRHGASASGSTPLYVVVSALTTRETIECALQAADAGADGVLVAPVCYVPLTDDEVVEHVVAVATAAPVPVSFYNNPTTTRYDITLTALQRLLTLGAVAGLKDTAPDAEQWAERQAGYRAAGVTVPVGLSRDALILSARSAGDAWHSGVAALVPEAYVGLRAALVAGDDVVVERWTAFLQPIVDELARCRPLAGLHALAVAAGVAAGVPRRPLPPAGDAVVERFRRLLSTKPPA